MASWAEHLPDYELIKWDLKRFPLDKSLWVRQAFEAKKYAFAADYIRLYALVTEGGIYLDGDVEVLKSFNNLLHLSYFICKENSPQGLEAAVIGAEAHTPWIEECLDYYRGKTFINEERKENTTVLPCILKKTIEKKYRLVYVNSVEDIGNREDEVYVLPSDYFSPKNYVNKKIKITNRTYAVHHFSGTWQPIWKKILLRIWVPISVRFPMLTEYIKNKFLR